MSIDPFPVEEPQESIGISTPDAVAIKLAILHTVKEGAAGETGSARGLARDLIFAFMEIDDQVAIRAKIEAAEKKKVGAYLASNGAGEPQQLTDAA